MRIHCEIFLIPILSVDLLREAFQPKFSNQHGSSYISKQKKTMFNTVDDYHVD